MVFQILGETRKTFVSMNQKLAQIENDRMKLLKTAIRAYSELQKGDSKENTRLINELMGCVGSFGIDKDMRNFRETLDAPDYNKFLVYDLPIRPKELLQKTFGPDITETVKETKDVDIDVICVRCKSDFETRGDPKLLNICKGDLIRITSFGKAKLRKKSSINFSDDDARLRERTGNCSPPSWWCGYVVNFRSSKQAWFPSNYVKFEPVDEKISLWHLLEFDEGVKFFRKHLKAEHSIKNLLYAHP